MKNEILGDRLPIRVSHIVAETQHGGLPLEEMQMLQLHQRFYVGVLCVSGSSSQGLAPWTGESSQPSWTHQGQGLHAAKSEATAKKTGLDVVTEEAHAAGEADYSVCTTGIQNSNSDISDDITMSSAKL
ncbi:hypothetical protein CFC21_052441 [Triticum aestivum]|uniref:Uncharacterized protein n=3 Tax=Triticum TaxID=4564 RepID=A0A9R1G8N1_WHEAT|nr:uncharacterized protein LOC119285944 [Triticum dicoccoides]XP_044363776.1 uncharacterized protein LOC123086133 [Triticum aestivum]KAF7042972.1 hypothetical protein CFC21_052441 [Triticum aestivum]